MTTKGSEQVERLPVLTNGKLLLISAAAAMLTIAAEIWFSSRGGQFSNFAEDKPLAVRTPQGIMNIEAPLPQFELNGKS